MSPRNAASALLTGESEGPSFRLPLHRERLRLLVVDDDASALQEAVTICERTGCTAARAQSFAEAQRRLAELRPAVCLVDQHLDGGIRGSDLIEWARRRRMSTLFIAMTARHRQDELVTALRAGAFDAVDKPVLPLSLSRALVRAAAVIDGQAAQEVSHRAGDAELAAGVLCALPDAVALLDAQGTVRLATPPLARLLGCREDQLSGWLSGDGGGLAEAIADLRGSGRARRVCITRPASAGGPQRVWIGVRAVPMPRGPHGEPGTLVLLSELDDRRPLGEPAAPGACRELITLFAGEMAHALADPLTVLVGTLEAVGPQLAAEDRARLETSVRRCLAVAAQAGASRLHRCAEPETVDLHEVLRETLGAWTPFLQRHELALAVDLSPGLAPVVIPRRELDQLAWLLCQNAFASPGATELSLSTTVRPSQITLLISNPGGQAPFELREEPLEPESVAAPRTSLELAVCRQIAVRWRGELRAVPGAARGGLVRLSLPCAGA